jgi:hypothetical protein
VKSRVAIPAADPLDHNANQFLHTRLAAKSLDLQQC